MWAAIIFAVSELIMPSLFVSPKQERKRKEIIHLTGDTKSEGMISSETAKMMAAHIATMMDNKSK